MARSFLKGVHHQGQHVLATEPAAAEERIVAEYLFIVTAHQAGLWLRESCRLGSVDWDDCGSYLSLIGRIKEVRDMREHADRYLQGDGDRQHRFVHHDEQRNAAADASSTIVTDDGYELGLRVTVEEVMRAASSALDAVRDASE